MVGDEADADDVEETGQVGGRGESVGLDFGEDADFLDDGWDEEGEGGEGDVAGGGEERVSGVGWGVVGEKGGLPAEVHYCREVGFGIFQTGEHFFDA